MNIVFLTYYYPPDLSAGSFRSIALAKALSLKMKSNDMLHIITTHPNRYKSYRVDASNVEINDKITIHRISVPSHKSGMFSQSLSFCIYAFYAYKLCTKLKPNFLIGTTGRLMTGVLTWVSSKRLKINYFIDLRDIFSETISDLFSRKNKVLGVFSNYIFSYLDHLVFRSAAGVNVVSEGFYDYFRLKGVNTSNWTFFPNGVDDEFIDFHSQSYRKSEEITTILYAGNIGSGQGLETIVPYIAKRLGKKFRFLIIGDGGKTKILKEKIKSEAVSNVEILLPVNRSELLNYYDNADILFLHLNDVPAFRRVLPSKIFEYAAIGKPIVAGLSGYSENFMKTNLPYANVFKSGSIEDAYSSVLKASTVNVPMDMISKFMQFYSRQSIMNKMASHIFGIIECKVIQEL
jgi:glycosyltransferase involved in cell wall biosynthesis